MGAPKTPFARGVTRHKKTRKWEAHVWHSDRRRQVYLGSYPNSDLATRASDVGALVFKGAGAPTNRRADEYDGVDTQSLRLLLARGETAAAVSGIRRTVARCWESRDLLHTVPPQMQLAEAQPVFHF